MFCSSDVSDGFLQTIYKLNDEKKKLSYKYYNKRITPRDNGIMFNLMIKKKVNWTAPLPLSAVLIHLHMTK